jgi:pSer/pThr/pTyr-binding forkhead associated (FHA) protein
VPQAVLIDAQNITGKKTFILAKRKTKIGRGVHNEIAISEKSISGSHAIIEYKHGAFYIEDQRSTNKTFINREEIEPYAPRKLKSGDEIMFDVYKFIFLLERQLPTGDTGRR